jgi:hypothetical protein
VTQLTKPISRETLGQYRHYGKTIIVTLFVDCVSLRLKGTRKPKVVDEEVRKAHPLSNKKENRRPYPRTPKRKDAPVPESKVISLDKRAEDEEKPFFEQLLKEHASYKSNKLPNQSI